MNFKFFLMGDDWGDSEYWISRDDFRFWLSRYDDDDYADFVEEFGDDVSDDGVVVVISGSVIAEIVKVFPDFPSNQFDVYDQTKSGTGHGLSPFDFSDRP